MTNENVVRVGVMSSFLTSPQDETSSAHLCRATVNSPARSLPPSVSARHIDAHRKPWQVLAEPDSERHWMYRGIEDSESKQAHLLLLS